MVTPLDPTQVIAACANEVGPPRNGAQLVAAQSAALGALMRAAGVTSCSQGTAIGAVGPAIGGGSFAHGCEQIAGLVSAMDVKQRIFECTFKQLQQTDTVLVRHNLQIKVEFADHVKYSNCNVVISQVSGMRVAAYSEFSEDVKQQMNNQLDAAMAGFLSNLQDEKTKGLFPTSNGQKAFQQFTQFLSQEIEQKAFQTTVQETLKQFESVALVEFKVGPWSTLGYDKPQGAGAPCVMINQAFVDQIVSQSVIQNALDQVFSNAAAADLKAILQSGQYKVNEGVSLPDFGSLIILVVVIVIAAIVLRNKPSPANGGEPKQIAPAWLGAVLFFAGIAAIIIAIVVVVIILKKGWLLGGLVLAGGVIIGILGAIMWVRATAQQKRFRQQLLLTQLQSGVAPTVDVNGRVVSAVPVPLQRTLPPPNNNALLQAQQQAQQQVFAQQQQALAQQQQALQQSLLQQQAQQQAILQQQQRALLAQQMPQQPLLTPIVVPPPTTIPTATVPV